MNFGNGVSCNCFKYIWIGFYDIDWQGKNLQKTRKRKDGQGTGRKLLPYYKMKGRKTVYGGTCYKGNRLIHRQIFKISDL